MYVGTIFGGRGETKILGHRKLSSAATRGLNFSKFQLLFTRALCYSEMAGFHAVEWQSVFLVWCVATIARAQSKFYRRYIFHKLAIYEVRLCRKCELELL